MKLVKEFKNQKHYFELPDEQARSLLAKDKRYSIVEEQEPIEKPRSGRPRKA